MRLVHLCFSSCATLLLLQLLALNWRTSTALPLPQSADKSAQCASLFKSLLLNVTELLKSEYLCNRLIKSMEVTVRSPETAQACAPTSPQNSGCVMMVNSSFSESECVMNIMKDLAYYDAAIESYLKSPLHMPEKEVPLLSPTLGIIQNLRKNCSSVANEGQYSSEDAANLWKNSSYVNRQKMCKMMKGFHVRAITINRAMGYISSGSTGSRRNRSFNNITINITVNIAVHPLPPIKIYHSKSVTVVHYHWKLLRMWCFTPNKAAQA